MDFSYSEEQQEVRNLAQKILGDQTENEHLREIDQQEDRLDDKLWNDLAEAGLLGVAIDEQYGGMGFGFETLCLLVEEVGRTVAPVPVIPALVSAATSLQKFASDDLKQQLLPGLVNGEHLLSTAMVEPSNEDCTAPKTTAEFANGQWQVTGHKHCVPFASRAKAVLLTAYTANGLAVFVVDPAANSVALSRQHVTAGEAQFDMQLAATAATLVAEGEVAEQLAQWLYESTAAAYAAMATGLCDKMMRMTASYTSERVQFGVAVATFQAVGHCRISCGRTFIKPLCQLLGNLTLCH